MTAPPAIRLDHVSKSFGALKVLDDVSLDIPQGHALVILGRSGTGKSVTLKSIIGLLRPDAGRIFVGVQEITAVSRSELAQVRRRIGFLFQHAALFNSITVGENVAFPLRRHTEWSNDQILDRVRDLLEQVGLERTADRMPGNLSGGMRKRAGLARAMALQPPILLVDEPSAGLDPVTAGEIDDLLIRLNEDRETTLVVVTHNIPSARRVGDELVFLHEGRIIVRGDAASLERSEHPMVREFMKSDSTG